MADAKQVVRDFCGAWERLDKAGDPRRVHGRRRLSQHPDGVPPTGKAAIGVLLELDPRAGRLTAWCSTSSTSWPTAMSC